MEEELNESTDLDLVTVFTSGGTTAEMEAIQVQSLLQEAGINAVLEAPSVLPNLPEEVRVAREDAPRAEELIKEALAAGPQAAAEAELAGEQ